MNEMPFFSVIVPVYNKEEFVIRALNSVLNQSFNDFELLVVCDPSTDRSQERLESVSDPRIRIFHRNQPGPGGYAARNLGIEKSRGTWLAFLDADDIWLPNRLLQMEQLINTFPEEKLFTCAYQIDALGRQRQDLFSQYFSGTLPCIFTFQDYLHYSVKLEKPFHTNTVTFRRDLLIDSKLFPAGQANRSGDLYAWVKLIAATRTFVWTPEVGAHLYKDIIGVSMTAVPSISLNLRMVDELASAVSSEELRWLKKYANRLMRVAHFEQVRLKGRAESDLRKVFFWRVDPFYCTFWYAVSCFPPSALVFLKWLKARLRGVAGRSLKS
ncbi:glycosyltransferase family 2 protein [Limnobacter sp.]